MAELKLYWDQRYSSQPFKSGKGPSAFVVSSLGRLKKGKTLDLAMGEGQNAVFLSQKGFDVTGVDVSEVALANANRLASETGVQIQTKLTDIDLLIFNLFEYDTVIMNFFKPALPRIYSEMIRTLKQGGTLLVESFTTEELKGNESSDLAYRDFYFQSNELLRNLKGLRILYYNEGEVEGRHVVQCIAQKPFDKDALKYGFDIAAKEKEATGPSAHQRMAEALFKKK